MNEPSIQKILGERYVERLRSVPGLGVTTPGDSFWVWADIVVSVAANGARFAGISFNISGMRLKTLFPAGWVEVSVAYDDPASFTKIDELLKRCIETHTDGSF